MLFFGLFLTGCCNPQSGYYATFRANNSHSGTYISAPLLKTPSLLWSFPTGGPIHSTGAIEGTKIYFGSSDSNLYNLDNRTGKLNWKYKTMGPVHSSPTLHNGHLFFISGDGRFYALDAASGKKLWDFQTAGEGRFRAFGIHGALPKDSLFEDPWDFYMSSAVVAGGIVYFGTGSGYLYAINESDGKPVWNFRSTGVIHCTPAIYQNKIYFGSWDTYFYCLDAVTGRKIWRFKTGEDHEIYNQTGLQASPLVEDGVVYIGCRDAHMYALKAETGAKIWDQFTDYAWVSASPVINNRLLIYATGDTHQLRGVMKETGMLYYETNTKGWIMSSPVVAGNIVYIGDINGFLYAFNANNGKKIWNYQLPSSHQDPFHILNPDSTLNTKEVFSKIKKQRENKSSMDMIYSLGAFIASPIVEDGKLFIGSANGIFYAFY
jgi:outer membrane protein assembly factor BamB